MLQTRRQIHFFQISAIRKTTGSYVKKLAGQPGLAQRTAERKDISRQFRNAGRYGDFSQRQAFAKGPLSYALEAGRQFDFFQRSATKEGIVSDCFEIARILENHSFYVASVFKCESRYDPGITGHGQHRIGCNIRSSLCSQGCYEKYCEMQKSLNMHRDCGRGAGCLARLRNQRP